MTETITGEWETALAALREMLSRLPSDAVVTIAVELTGEGHLTASRLSMSGKVHVTAPEEDDDDSWIDTPEWQSRLERAEKEMREGHGRNAMTGEELITRFNADV